MMSNDLINSLFELGGAVVVLLNVRALYQHKEVRGVFMPAWLFFSLFGFWNLYYYPSLDQVLSFYAGIVLVIGNMAWLILALHYRRTATVEVTGIRKIST